MRIRRRDFLKFAGIQSVLSSLPFQVKAEASASRRSGFSILQGATDEFRTQFSIVHDPHLEIDFLIIDSNAKSWAPDKIVKITPPGARHEVTQIYCSGLKLGFDFVLAVLDAKTRNFLDARQFRGLDLEKKDLKFALCSCMDDDNHTPGIWQDLISRLPDVIFFLGDSVYCDKETHIAPTNAPPEKLFRRFSEARRTLEIYFSKRLIPILAVWDDHDFGQNDVGQNYAFLKESQENFFRFFMQNETYCRGLVRGPGISTGFVAAGQQFLLLDDRSFRKPQGSRDRYAHWGYEQEQWFMQRIEAHDGPTWIFNGSQMFPQMIFKESVSGNHPEQFTGFVDRLKATGKKIIFGSGDVHFSEVSKIEPEKLGYTSYELTSSSIHSFKWPGIPELIFNHRRIAVTGHHNYLLVQSATQGSGCKAFVESRSERNQLNFALDLEV